jgi:hypothetical protein
VIRQLIEGLPINKWGWVIYRCTYADDDTWAQFRARVEAESREYIAESDAPEIAERLEWTWIEDKSGLDRLSTAALRNRFRAWVADEVARQPGDYIPSDIPRFRYFVKIDEEVIQSFGVSKDSFQSWMGKKGFVNLVDADWEQKTEDQKAEEHEDEEWWEEEKLEPIDGCTEEHVGWMRIAPFMINADFYEMLNGDEYWYMEYKRPPSIVVY